MMNAGIRKRVIIKPLKSPMKAPSASAMSTASTDGTPRLTTSTAITEAQKPLTAPTERSIHPSSRMSTTPIEMVATAACCSMRLVRLPGLRKRSFCSWKNVQMTATMMSTRSVPASP